MAVFLSESHFRINFEVGGTAEIQSEVCFVDKDKAFRYFKARKAQFDAILRSPKRNGGCRLAINYVAGSATCTLFSARVTPKSGLVLMIGPKNGDSFIRTPDYFDLYGDWEIPEKVEFPNGD